METDEAYFESYGDVAVHRLMIQDAVRTDAYRRAIEQLVEPGMRVLDVGAGSGILSLFAARAGAEHVHAVDRSAIIELAKKLAKTNGLADRITFQRGLVEEQEITPPVDLVVSEWFGFFGLAETMFKSFVHARELFLAPGGSTLPARFSLHVAPIQSEVLYCERGPGLWETPVYGFDFEQLVDVELMELEATSVVIPPDVYLAAPVAVLDLDCCEAAVGDYFFDAHVEFEFERSGVLHGFAGHFDSELAPGVVLSTSSLGPETHWRQTYFPIRKRDVRAGDCLRLRMQALDAERGDKRLPIYLFEGELERAGERVDRFFYKVDATFE